MNNSAILQLRLNPTLKKTALKRAETLGYSSLQELIRGFLSDFAMARVTPKTIYQEPDEEIILSPKAKKRWEKHLAAIEKDEREGNYIQSSNIDEIMDFLNSDD